MNRPYRRAACWIVPFALTSLADANAAAFVAGASSTEPLATVAQGSGASDARTSAAVRWDARAAEHLLNRAGFGGSQAEVERLVAMGQAAAIESFFPDPRVAPPPVILSLGGLRGGFESPAERHATMEARRESLSRMQVDLIVPLNRYADWWIERMLRSEDPLRDRMTIFWHGHFVSSVKDVGNSHDMIKQVAFLRDCALGPFETLVRGIGRDPAMLRYLNNDNNVKDHPNENWARELMELFSLGDGNYTETDIKQAARAFTGWSRGPRGFEYKRLDHDFGTKEVLSVAGNLDGDQVIDVVLEQPACARFVARKLLAYFEGMPPAAERVEDYAAYLRGNGYDIGKMLRRLFADPHFYSDEVVAHRVAAPVEYLVGCARRLGIEPPGQMVLNAGDVLGQRLFWPPSVKGWEEGLAWITTSSMMQRSNMVGVMMGLVDVTTLMHDDEFSGDAMSAGARKSVTSRTNGFNHLRYVQLTGWKPEFSLVERARGAKSLQDAARKEGKATDEVLARWLTEELLAVPYSPESTREAFDYLRGAREKAGIAEGALLAADAGPQAEAILRGLAHVILSLPEAQLN